MKIQAVMSRLQERAASGFDVYERRPGKYQLSVPIRHEDGDMVDIYLEESPLGGDHVRICDHGLTMMRLSCTLDVNTPKRRRVLESIVHNNEVGYTDGILFLDAHTDRLYEGLLQFAGCAQKVCNMRYWSRTTRRTSFYEDLGAYVQEELAPFSPAAGERPLPGFPIDVDWSLTCNQRRVHLFGVRGNEKAKHVAISLLEFKSASLPFLGFVVHEDMVELGSKETVYLTRNADKQYPALDDFRQHGPADIRRITGAAA